MVILVTIHGVQEKKFPSVSRETVWLWDIFSGTPGILSSYSTFDAPKLANHCFGGHLMCILIALNANDFLFYCKN